MTEKPDCQFYIESKIFKAVGKEKVDTGETRKLCMLYGIDCQGKCEHANNIKE